MEGYFGFLERFSIDIGTQAFKQQFGAFWWVFYIAALLVISILAVILRRVLHTAPSREVPDISPLALEKNLLVLRKKVKSYWIEGLLEESLYRKMLLELGMKHSVGAVEDPWETKFIRQGGASAPVPRGKKIESVFAEARSSLLILGKPGSGKTITLLRLARELVMLSESDASLPIPVVFNLSSWSERKLPFHEWIEEEFIAKYQVGHSYSKAWIKEGRIVFLLDGLDEVREDSRDMCATAINRFMREQDIVPGIVICSRKFEYEALGVRLKLGGAITIEPLQEEQLKTYLKDAGRKLEGLREALEVDETLMVLAQKPLMLNLMSLAYEGVAKEHFRVDLEGSGMSNKEQLYDAYIARMFERKGKREARENKQIIKQLSFMAQQMRDHSKSIFLIEELQQSWLSIEQARKYYIQLDSWVMGLSFALFFSLVGGLVSGPISALYWALPGGLVGALGGYLFNERIAVKYTIEIKTVDIFNWSWSQFLHGLVSWESLVVGPAYGTFIGLLFGLSGGIIDALLAVFAGTFFWCTSVSITRGLSVDVVKEKTKPNEGIWRSIKNYSMVFLVGGLVGGLVVGIAVGLVHGLVYGLILGSLYGMFLGFVITAQKFGGSIVLHYKLRVVLWLMGYLPFRLVHFLEQSVSLIFMQRVGGGYIFIHRTLLEHFADLTEERIEEIVNANYWNRMNKANTSAEEIPPEVRILNSNVEMPGRPKVFISYAAEDARKARQLFSDLKAQGVDCWLDKENLGPGRWKKQIQKAIPQSRFFLFCVSSAAFRKTQDGIGFVDDELQQAYSIAMDQDERHFTIIPVRFEDVEFSDHRISVFQWYDLFDDWEGEIDKLAEHLMQGLDS